MSTTTPTTDSVVSFRNSQGLEARGTLMRLTRTMAVFEVYNPYSIVQLSEVLSDVKVRRGGRTIYHGRAVVSNLVSTGLLLIVSVTLVDPWTELAGLEPGGGLREETQSFLEDWEAERDLRRSFQLNVSNTRNLLEELSRWLQAAEVINTGEDEADAAGAKGLEREFLEEVHEPLAPKLDELFEEFEEEASQIPRDQMMRHKAFAQRELHPLILCAPFVHRTFSKPLGYAGDYEMLNMILRDPLDGNSAYAKIVNTLLLRKAPAEAYKNRIGMLHSRLRREVGRVKGEGRTPRMMNVACGPVNEIQRFVREDELAEHCAFHLLDFNGETLQFARTNLDAACRDTGRHIETTYDHKSIHELLQEARGKRDSFAPSFDMVYCAGLFDYLSDRICNRLLRLFYSWLNPGGLVIATNVKHSRPILGFMEMLLEWHLIYRDESDMLSLTPTTGEQWVDADDTDINMFLQIRKPEEEGPR